MIDAQTETPVPTTNRLVVTPRRRATLHLTTNRLLLVDKQNRHDEARPRKLAADRRVGVVVPQLGHLVAQSVQHRHLHFGARKAVDDHALAIARLCDDRPTIDDARNDAAPTPRTSSSVSSTSSKTIWSETSLPLDLIAGYCSNRSDMMIGLAERPRVDTMNGVFVPAKRRDGCVVRLSDRHANLCQRRARRRAR